MAKIVKAKKVVKPKAAPKKKTCTFYVAIDTSYDLALGSPLVDIADTIEEATQYLEKNTSKENIKVLEITYEITKVQQPKTLYKIQKITAK